MREKKVTLAERMAASVQQEVQKSKPAPMNCTGTYEAGALNRVDTAQADRTNSENDDR
jgi:hypothetical protein